MKKVIINKKTYITLAKQHNNYHSNKSIFLLGKIKHKESKHLAFILHLKAKASICVVKTMYFEKQ